MATDPLARKGSPSARTTRTARTTGPLAVPATAVPTPPSRPAAMNGDALTISTGLPSQNVAGAVSSDPLPWQKEAGSMVDPGRTDAIGKLYGELLGRQPDAVGLNGFYLSGLSIDQIRTEIATSPEGKLYSRHAALDKAFKEVLKRDPGSLDLDKYLASNQPIAQVRAELASSPEGKRLGRQEAITALYREVLKREPSPSELQTYVDSPRSLEEIKALVSNGPDAMGKNDFVNIQASANRKDAINDLYKELLGRKADTAGLEAFFNSNLSIDQVRTELANSPEGKYYARYNAVAALYKEVLGRPHDRPGLQGFLDSNLSIEQVREALANSPEAKAKAR